MKLTGKRMISLLLCFVMVLALLPTTAFADTLISGTGWRLDKDGTLYLTGSIINSSQTSLNQAPWHDFADSIKAVIAQAGSSINSLRSAFAGCDKLVTVDLRKLNTSSVTDMCNTFAGCKALVSADLSGIDTSHVTTMCSMFSDCYDLRILDISGIKTSSLVDTASMFAHCHSLTELDLKHFDTSRVTDMSQMFFGCFGLWEVDVSSFNTASVTNMRGMFAHCYALREVDVSSFDTRNVKNMSIMFAYDHAMTSLDLRNFRTDRLENVSDLIKEDGELITLGTNPNLIAKTADQMLLYSSHWADVNTHASYEGEAALKAISAPAMLTRGEAFGFGWWLDGVGCIHMVDFVQNPSPADHDASPWKDYKSQITAVVAEPGAAIDNGAWLFSSCTKLKYADLRNLDTSKVTSMRYMFALTNLRNLDLSGFNTANVTDMFGMFSMNTNIRELNLSAFDTSKVTDMSSMFTMSFVEKLNLGSFKVNPKVKTAGMFSKCSKLSEIVTNHDLLQTTAEQLIELSPIWYHAEKLYSYSDADEMKTISGKATLVTPSRANEYCYGDQENCPLAKFTDAPKYSNWAHKGIEFCLRTGLMSGTSATTFGPKTPMSRAMLVTVLYRMDGQPGPGKTAFSDVPGGKWFSDAVSWAADYGIVTGVGSGRFNPNGNVTREQIATILYRYAAYKGYDTGRQDNLAGFADAAKVGKWFVDGMKWAVAEGLITGSVTGGKTYLSPQGDATREQVAAILMRFCENVATRP